MLPQAFQPGEVRDNNDNIVSPGAYGKNTPLVTADNQGILDYIINNFATIKQDVESTKQDVESTKQDVESVNNGLIQSINGVSTVNGGAVTLPLDYLSGMDNKNGVVGGAYRKTDANIDSTQKSGLSKFLSTPAMTANAPEGEGHIINLDWDNGVHYNSQLYIPLDNVNKHAQIRCNRPNGWQPWKSLAYLDDTIIRIPYLSYTQMPSQSTDAQTFFKEWLSYVAQNYASLVAPGGEVIARVQPNVQGTVIGHWYTETPTNPTTGLPKYPSFIYISLNGVHFNFGTNDYEFYFANSDTTYNLSTTATAGLMSAADKIKLNSIQSGTVTGLSINANTYIQGSYTFPTPFYSTPKLNAVITSGKTNLTISLFSISETGFSYTITNAAPYNAGNESFDWIGMI